MAEYGFKVTQLGASLLGDYSSATSQEDITLGQARFFDISGPKDLYIIPANELPDWGLVNRPTFKIIYNVELKDNRSARNYIVQFDTSEFAIKKIPHPNETGAHNYVARVPTDLPQDCSFSTDAINWLDTDSREMP